MNLPSDFVDRIRKQLKSEADVFLASYEKEALHGLRINTLKKNFSGLCADYKDLPFNLTPTAWEPMGFMYPAADTPGKSALHDAGVYYIQEPSAMLPVTKLMVQKGDRVLDLCAAPGGKSTQIASYLCGEGLLVSNEIHPQRAKILSENIERMGVRNAVVTNEDPHRLKEFFHECFNKVLVDAPCSGEGMFRKNPEAVSEWSLENVALCADRQDSILDDAYEMLRWGGRMVYSTCTFSEEEDELCMERFIGRHPDMILLSMEKIWPHKESGEGHFAAVLTKGPEITSHSFDNKRSFVKFLNDKELKYYIEFAKENLSDMSDLCENIISFGDNLYKLPTGITDLKGLKIERPGLHLGTLKKERFEPSHAFALSLCPNQINNYTDYDLNDDEIRSYLSGQILNVSGRKGWHLITVNGFSLGWGKLCGNIMKNHYPKGLRKP